MSVIVSVGSPFAVWLEVEPNDFAGPSTFLFAKDEADAHGDAPPVKPPKVIPMIKVPLYSEFNTPTPLPNI